MKSERFMGAYLGLAVVAWGALFFLILLPLAGHAYRKHAETTPRLSQWSLARMLSEMGEYDQKIPNCAGLVDGMNGYAYAKINKVTGQLKGVVLICK